MGLSHYCLLLCALVATYGLEIDFTSLPTEGIKVPFTEQLVLRCVIKDETASTSKILGALQSTPKSKRAFQHVASIIVTRGSTHVASVTQYAPAQAFTDKSNLQVKGAVSGLTQEDAYLELIWTFPSQAQAGAYVCEMTAVDEFGHYVVFTKPLQVDNHPVTMTEVLDYIVADRQIVKELNKSVIQVKHDLQSLHTETGNESCGESNTWTSSSQPSDDSKNKRVTVKFAKAYNNIPKVATGFSVLDVNKNYNTRVGVHVVNVTKTDFTVECFTWGNTYVYKCDFFWISND